MREWVGERVSSWAPTLRRARYIQVRVRERARDRVWIWVMVRVRVWVCVRVPVRIKVRVWVRVRVRVTWSMGYQLDSDPKDGPIHPGSKTAGGAPRLVLSRGRTAEGDPVVVSSFNFENGSEAWKRTRKGSRGAFQQVWKL